MAEDHKAAEDTADLVRHLQNAGNPQGEYGASLLDIMNAGEHERLSAWGLSLLERDAPGLRGLGRSGGTAGNARPRMLDLGCGGGANLVRLYERFGGHVTGLDHSPVSQEKSRETCAARLPQGAWEVVAGDVAQLPFAAGSFDLVTAFETLYFWPDPKAAVEELCRVLAPGGIAFICNEAGGTPEMPDWAVPLRLFHADELARLLADAGLKSVRTHAADECWLCATAVAPGAAG